MLSALSALVVTLPAEAAQLQSWWFDVRNNQLTFTTDVGVQPRAQMIFNPTRIVIDLPGTTLGRATQSQRVGGAVREVRAGQFDAQTTRLVIELGPGYTVDPQQVAVRGLSATQWVVQLPAQAAGAAPPATTPGTTGGPNQVLGQGTAGAAAQLAGIVATGDGFLLQVSGTVPRPVTSQSGSGSGRTLTIELPNTAIAPGLQASALPNNRYSVTTWQVTQIASVPPATRVTLTLGAGSPDWRVLNNQGGVILLPPRGVLIGTVPDSPPAAAPPAGAPSASAPQPTQPIPVPPLQTTPAPQPQPFPPGLPPVRDERVVVVLDPGHGGADPGAVGIGGLQEKQVIFPIALRVRQLLEAQGITVVMTREDDRTLDLQPRVDIAERADADLFVSIHANAISLSRPDVNGLESYYSSETGRRLAATIHASMLAATGMNDRGVKQAGFFVIRRTSMPATLLELGFVTGAQDAPRLRDPAWRETMANAIARGILQYIEQTR